MFDGHWWLSWSLMKVFPTLRCILPGSFTGGSWRQLTFALRSIVCFFRPVSAAKTHFLLSVQKRRDFLVVAWKQERTFPFELVSPFPAGACIFVRKQRFALLQSQASRMASMSF